MTLTLTSAVRTAMADAAVDLVDAGSADAAGELRLYDDGALTTLLVSIPLNNPAFGAASAGVAALDTAGGLSAAAVASGVTTVGVVVDRDNAEVYRGAVSESGGGGDFIISDTSISTSDLVQINSASFTMPAS